jgi:Meckel syndrome type 1 protein
MATEKPVAIRSEIQRLLDQFTRGTIDFQALLGALDQTFLADPTGRRIALELVDKQNPNGALQRSFFRVLKERLEQQLATGSPPPPRAPSGRGMPEWKRAAPSPQSAGARPPARPFGSRLRARDERAQSEATRPFEQSSPQEKDERTPYDMTLPFPPPRVRDEQPVPEATRPLVPSESPRREMSSAEARAAFRPPPPEHDEPATAEATRPLAPEPSSDALSREETTSTPTPPPVPDEPAPSETKEAVPAPPAPEERAAGRRRSSFTRGRYANRWAQRQGPKEPPSQPASARSEPAVSRDLDAAAAQDLDTAAATRPPDFDVGTPIEEGVGTTDSASAASGADAALTKPPDELIPPRSEPAAPAPSREAEARESAHPSPEPPAADEPAMAAGEAAEPVRSEPPPRSPFSRRREPPREHPFVTEYRPITPPRPQPLAWIGGVLILLLLLALMLLGPLKEFVPGFAAYVQREIPAASRALAPAPEKTEEKSPPAAVAPSSTQPTATRGAAPAEAPVEPTAPVSSNAGDTAAKPSAAATSSSKTGARDTGAAASSANASGAAKPGTSGTGVPPTTKAPAPVTSSTTTAPAPAPSSKPKAPSAGAAAAPAKSAPAKTASASIPPPVSAPAGRFAFASRSYSGRESGGMVAIRIVRRGGAAGIAYVTWTTRPDSAAPGDDYADFGPRMESFADGERERVIYVPIANDDMAEPRESFAVQLQDPSDGATLDGTSSTTVTILDDDS